MFRSRKRKVSPDKKPDKAKKLKVSSKIFRSPNTTKVTASAKSKLNKLLPEGYEYIILTATTKPVESFAENEAVIGSVRLPIATKEDAMVWVKKFERKTFTSYRTQKTWKKDNNTGLLKRKYICNFRTREKNEVLVPPSCKGNITLIMKDQDDAQANSEYCPKDYPSQAIIHFYHSHKIDPDSYMKNLRPSAELRIIFGTYFAKGHSPFSALICHKSDLHSSYGAEFYNVVSNGAICPSYNWCFNEYEKFFMRKFLEPSEEKLKEKLLDNLTQFNSKWRSECALISDDPAFVLSICTPLMKSVFRSGFAESFVSVRCFSTPKSVPKRHKLILFLCHTPIGSLPFGVVVTYAEDAETVCKGIRVLVHMLGLTTYQPKTIITDEDGLVSKALKRCFPESQILFNEFQMLQSIWRIIRIVCAADDEEFQSLYNLFLVTLNSGSEEEFNRNFDCLLVYAEKYPKLTNFLKFFKLRAEAYVFYARPKSEFDTDLLNYTDSGTTILQDVLIKYGNFFNIVQLFDFLTKNYVDHYERKLTRIVEGDMKGFFKTNFYVPLSKIADFTCEKISDTEFIISLNEMKFFVNAQLDTCTCQVGVYGGSCVHQYIVEKRLGLTPECYTPLCDEILNILKQILAEKNTKPPALESDNRAEFRSSLGSFKSGLETLDSEPDTSSDIVPSVGCSELSNFSGMPHDMDNLGPLEEVFTAPPDITDTLTDITEEAMSPLVLSEFEDAHDDNEDFLDDSEPYNRESGEIEPKEQSDDILEFSENLPTEIIPRSLDQPDEDFFDDSELYNRESGEVEPKEQSDDIQETDTFSNNLPTEIISESLDQSVPSTSNVEMCEYDEGVISGKEDELEVEQGIPEEPLKNVTVDDSIILNTDIQGSEVYSFPIENQNEIEYFETTMTENERKTAEIAEFLTNLPDTNNLSSGTLPQVVDVVQLVDKDTNDEYNEVISTTDYIEEEVIPIVEQDQVISNGVVVLSNEEYFTNYNILENNVLAVVPENDNAMFSKNENNVSDTVSFDVTTSEDAQNIITDSYEESNLVMMSPNDLFDDNQSPETTGKHEGKINVLSSVIIKPSTVQMFSLNLNSLKNKTLRTVKEDNFPRTKKSGNIQNTQDQTELETQIIPEKEADISENDVIKLYCNQSGDKISVEEKELEEFCEVEPSNIITSSENEFKPDTNADRVLETETKIQKSKTKQVASKVKGKNSDVKKVDKTLLSSKTGYSGDKNVKDCKEISFPDCDLEELAKHDFMEIEEIDSDDLEDLASQDYDPDAASPIPEKTPIVFQPLSSEKTLKLIPMKNVPSGLLSFSQKSSTARSDVMSLKDFMSNNKASQKFQELSAKKQTNMPQSAFGLKENASQEIKDPYAKKQPNIPQSAIGLKENASQKVKESYAKKQTNMPNSAGGLKENASLKKHLPTFLKLENLMGKETFKDSVVKFLEKRTADDTSSQKMDDTQTMINRIQSLGNSITLAPVQSSRTVKKSPVNKNLNTKPKSHTVNTKTSTFNLKGSQQTRQNTGDNRAETGIYVIADSVCNENTNIINKKLTNFKQNQININERKSLSDLGTLDQGDKTRQNNYDNRAKTATVIAERVYNEKTNTKNKTLTNFKQNETNIKGRKPLSAFKTFDQGDSKTNVSDFDEECESNASYSILDELSEEELIALGIISEDEEDYSSDDSNDRSNIYRPPSKSFSRTHLERDSPDKSLNSRIDKHTGKNIRVSFQPQRTLLGNKNKNNTVNSVTSRTARLQPKKNSNKNDNNTIDSVTTPTASLQPEENPNIRRRSLRKRTITPKYNDPISSDDEFDGLITKVTDLVDKTKRKKQQDSRNSKQIQPDTLQKRSEDQDLKRSDVSPETLGLPKSTKRTDSVGQKLLTPVLKCVPLPSKQFQQSNLQSPSGSKVPDNMQKLSETQDLKRSVVLPETLGLPKSTKTADNVSQTLLIPVLKCLPLPSQQFQQSNPQILSGNRVPGSNVILTTLNQSPYLNARTNVKQAYLINFPNDVTVRKVCDKNQSLKQVSSPSIIIDTRRFESPKPNSRGKDIKDLEAVLTSTVDTDYAVDSDAALSDTKRIQATSVIHNQDLSFLFNDPRFETIVEEENADASKRQNILLKSQAKISRNEVSPKKPMASANAFLFENPQFDTSVAADKANAFKVQTDSLQGQVKSSKHEVSPEKIESSADSRAKKSVGENVTSAPTVQNNIITLMIFKDGTIKPLGENPDSSLKTTYHLVHSEIYKSTNKSGGNVNVKKPNINSYEKYVALETSKKTKEKTSTKEVLTNKVEKAEPRKIKSLALRRLVEKKEIKHISNDKSEVETLGDKKRSASGNKNKNDDVKSVSKTRSGRSLQNNQNNIKKESKTRDKSNSKKGNVKTAISDINTRQTRNRSFDKQKNTKKTIELSKKSLKSVTTKCGYKRPRVYKHKVRRDIWRTRKRSSSGLFMSDNPDRQRKENKNTKVIKKQTEPKKRNDKQRSSSSSKNREVESESEINNDDATLKLDTHDFNSDRKKKEKKNIQVNKNQTESKKGNNKQRFTSSSKNRKRESELKIDKDDSTLELDTDDFNSDSPDRKREENKNIQGNKSQAESKRGKNKQRVTSSSKNRKRESKSEIDNDDSTVKLNTDFSGDSPNRKREENKIIQGNTNQTESKKGNNKQRFASSSKNRKPESESQLENYDSTLELDTDDFEDSIVASVLKKHTFPTKENKLDRSNKGLFASTPKKSIGYEDAFKMFLESSNQWSFSKELDRSVSDFEKDIDDSDWESNRGSRRRTKSVSSPKEQAMSSKNSTPAKIKKSVSWADGLNRINYIPESDSSCSSDDSEVVTRKPKLSKPKSKSPNRSSKGRFTSVTTYETDDRKLSRSPAVKGRHRSVSESPVSKKSSRSRSVAPKRETVKSIRRSQSCSRAKQVKSRLVVLIKKDRKIDAMCMLLNSTIRSATSRHCGRGRIGLKELLQRARSVKNM